METESITKKFRDDKLEHVLGLIISESGGRSDLTHYILKVANESKRVVGEANALLIEGLLQFDLETDMLKTFLEAEQKGCDHPLLYHYIAEYYRLKNEDVSKVFEYSAKAISGKL